MYGFHGILSFLENKSIINSITKGTYKLNEAFKIAHAKSSQQLLANYVDFFGELNYTEFNLWQEELRSLGFPNGDSVKPIRLLAIANGSYQTANVLPHYMSANLTAGSEIGDVLLPLTGLLIGTVFQDFWAGMIGLIPGKSTITSNIEFNPTTSPGQLITNVNLKCIVNKIR